MALRYIFLDFDSFFASVEQQFRPELRKKPVGVVPSLGVDTTCCIAASYEAKAYGVKTGTGVREARSLCPGIQLVEANHTRYVKIHKRLKELIHQVIYVEEVLSIDEMYGRLPPHWQHPEVAQSKASEVKSLIRDKIGTQVSVSIGLAPNRFIAKLASKLKKPDGLVCVDFKDLPLALYPMELSDITGIGPRMLRRLRNARILNMETHCFPTQDSVALGQLLDALWADRLESAPSPTKVGVTFTKLVHHKNHTISLFPEDNDLRRMQLQHTMDAINKEHGGRSLYYANSMEAQKDCGAAPMRIAFTHIPDLELEDDTPQRKIKS